MVIRSSFSISIWRRGRGAAAPAEGWRGEGRPPELDVAPLLHAAPFPAPDEPQRVLPELRLHPCPTCPPPCSKKMAGSAECRWLPHAPPRRSLPPWPSSQGCRLHGRGLHRACHALPAPHQMPPSPQQLTSPSTPSGVAASSAPPLHAPPADLLPVPHARPWSSWMWIGMCRSASMAAAWARPVDSAVRCVPSQSRLLAVCARDAHLAHPTARGAAVAHAAVHRVARLLELGAPRRVLRPHR
ncbi:hypothetical protein BRADI_2g26351v3 [Brachypodium distachyon]|uniref:Uncharacterized protein n=1 Tax=Brachypodium distachyon TaxID=15368 RepID=A0A0Q3K6G9_BRADI|nr:hypothetical protein BRADI_2g26351v3 [Brachypodium distachyon]